jgi:hypothetical protein
VCRVPQVPRAAQLGLLECRVTGATGDQQDHRHVVTGRPLHSAESVVCQANILLTHAGTRINRLVMDCIELGHPQAPDSLMDGS